MQIVLGGLAGEAQREFFDYFNAALRRIGGGAGWSGFNPDGSFEVSLECTLPVDDVHACLVWHWIRKPDGSVDALDVLPEHEGTPAGWEKAASEFVTGVLVTALQKKRTDFFNRTTYFYIGVNLDGEYWLPGTRIAPAIYDDVSPYLINCERAVYIDQKVIGIDAAQAGEVGGARARRIAARASLLLNVGFYQTVPDLRFVLHAESTPAVVPGRLHLGFVDPRARPARMPEKARECPLGQYLERGANEVRRPDEKLRFPAETRSIFRAADNPAHLFGEAFDRCARLYQVSLIAGKHFPTVRLAYQVAAVEAISQAIPELSAFTPFMRRYSPATEDLEAVLEYLYGSVRSAHFHAGSFPLGDFLEVGIDLTDSERMERSTTAYNAQYLIRRAILAWARESSAAIDLDARKNPA